jgi:hypothetical protein
LVVRQQPGRAEQSALAHHDEIVEPGRLLKHVAPV